MKTTLHARFLLLTCLSLQQSIACGNVVTEVFCFEASTPKKIQLELRTYFDTDIPFEFGYVRYAKSTTPIALVLKSTTTESSDGNQPSEATRNWVEVINGELNGAYEMISQGASVSSFVYQDIKRSKATHFWLSPTATGTHEAGCKWSGDK